ncbi:MAG: hypothetical protein IAF38_16560 [Bacteroidia bacterium]|nr:hypothetical protein [Bacteroidia bacterium]
MKPKTFKIQMENPCTQSWDEMQVKGDGRSCTSCTKVVVDFSGMTDTQISLFLKKHYSTNSGQHLCGRIQTERLSTTFYSNATKPLKFNFSLLRYSLAGILTFSSLKTFSQTNAVGQEKIVDNSGKHKKDKPDTNKPVPNKILRLKVVDEKTGKGIKDSYIEVSSGDYKFTGGGAEGFANVPGNKNIDSLIVSVSAPGHESYYEIIRFKDITKDPLVIKLPVYIRHTMGIMIQKKN